MFLVLMKFVLPPVALSNANEASSQYHKTFHGRSKLECLSLSVISTQIEWLVELTRVEQASYVTLRHR
jgi:hypothetical protein